MTLSSLASQARRSKGSTTGSTASVRSSTTLPHHTDALDFDFIRDTKSDLYEPFRFDRTPPAPAPPVRFCFLLFAVRYVNAAVCLSSTVCVCLCVCEWECVCACAADELLT